MQSALLLSLKPKFAAAIYEGRKRVEFRRLSPRCQTPIKAFIYETLPVGRVTGTVEVVDIIKAPVGELLNLVSVDDPLRKDYQSYLLKALKPCALALREAKRFDKNLSIAELFDSPSRPPQSFCYVRVARR